MPEPGNEQACGELAAEQLVLEPEPTPLIRVMLTIKGPLPPVQLKVALVVPLPDTANPEGPDEDELKLTVVTALASYSTLSITWAVTSCVPVLVIPVKV